MTTPPGSGGDAGAFVGHWTRHTSGLDINADGSGQVLFGNWCCNSISVPLSVRPDGSGGLVATVAGPATLTGTTFDAADLPQGTTMTLAIGQSEPTSLSPTSGPILLMSDAFAGATADQIVWCGEFYDSRCGA